MGETFKIVAFNAVPKSGKSTVADALAAGHGFAHLALGDAMRAVLAGLGYPLELFTDPVLKELPRADMYGRTPREMMISLGAWRRSISDQFWIDRMLGTAPVGAAGWVIADVGTLDEVDFIRFVLGAPIIRLVRTGVEAIPDGRILVDPDKTICNDGTPAETAAQVVHFAEAWRQAA